MRRVREELSTLGDTRAEGIAVHNLALAAGYVGDHEAQAQLIREALDLLRDQNDPIVYRLAHRNLALLELRRGYFARALESLEKALAAERSIGFAAEEVVTLRLLGRDSDQQVLALDLVARLTTNAANAIAAGVEADGLARRMGLHPAERPDRRDRAA